MKSFTTMMAIFACICMLHWRTAAAYSATLSPRPLASTVLQQQLLDHQPPLQIRSTFQRVFRRRVQTLERPKEDKKQKKEPEQQWRVMFHNSEYMPDRVARVLARIIPTLDRRAAFEVCTLARSVGKVPVYITNQREAEMYCLLLQRQGLTATKEPLGDK